jgi:hypothetical protein
MSTQPLLVSLLAAAGVLCQFVAAQDLTKITAQPAQQATSVSERLVGSWRLISVETIRPNGDVIYPFYGRHPEGLLIYDRSGWMSVQIVSDPKPTVPTVTSREAFQAASPVEKAIAIDGFYAYYGTWSVDSSGSTVTHNIRQSLYPGERGEAGIRRLTLDGSRLILSAKTHEMGEDHERKLVWERRPAMLH